MANFGNMGNPMSVTTVQHGTFNAIGQGIVSRAIHAITKFFGGGGSSRPGSGQTWPRGKG